MPLAGWQALGGSMMVQPETSAGVSVHSKLRGVPSLFWIHAVPAAGPAPALASASFRVTISRASSQPSPRSRHAPP